MTMTDTPTFALAIGNDTARTGLNDPVTSHIAGDRSAPYVSKLQQIVLHLIASAEFGLTDTELDDEYKRLQPERGWPSVRDETPRKRRSDLAHERFGMVVDSGVKRISRHDSPEIVWVLA